MRLRKENKKVDFQVKKSFSQNKTSVQHLLSEKKLLPKKQSPRFSVSFFSPKGNPEKNFPPSPPPSGAIPPKCNSSFLSPRSSTPLLLSSFSSSHFPGGFLASSKDKTSRRCLQILSRHSRKLQMPPLLFYGPLISAGGVPFSSSLLLLPGPWGQFKMERN